MVPRELVTGYHMGHESELLIPKVRDFCEICMRFSEFVSYCICELLRVCRIVIQGIHMKCVPYYWNLINVLKGTEITTECILVCYMIKF